MNEFEVAKLKNLYVPPPGSHKGQNGKLLFIGGSELFHAASLWALNIASRIVDMVFYASVPVNNEIVKEAKSEFRDGIVIPREHIEDYIQEADCVLIGPGMVRSEKHESRSMNQELTLNEISKIEDEGEQTYHLTKYLLTKYPKKRWVIDGGALQMMDPEWLRDMPEVILTPHGREFEGLVSRITKKELGKTLENMEKTEQVEVFAKEYGCIVLLKGEKDIVSNGQQTVEVSGGNAGMTKGGTGDVLAGLVAALACKNDLFLSATCGSYINKKAGESLFKKVGYVFNSSDLVAEIPYVLKSVT